MPASAPDEPSPSASHSSNDAAPPEDEDTLPEKPARPEAEPPVSLRGTKPPPSSSDSEMTRRMRARKWADTPLGPVEDWPPALGNAVDLMLGAEEAISIYWGPRHILLYNDAWREFIGDKHPEALGQPAREVFPELWEAIGPKFDYVLGGNGAASEREQRLPLERAGTIEDTWFDYSFNPILMADGTVGGVFNIGTEVTERIKAETALRESEARLDAFVTATSDVVYRMSADWSEMYYLDGRSFVVDTDEPRETWLDEYIPEDERARVMAFIEEAIATKSVLELEHQVVQVDGTHGWAHSRAVPILDEDGEIVEWFGTATDITERKKTKRALERQATLDAFRVELTDAIRSLADPVEIQETAARILGQTLNADRANYGTVLADDNTNVVEADFRSDDVPSLVGEHQLADYGSYIAESLRENETLVVDDVRGLTELSEAEQSMYEQAKATAWIGVPLHKEGELSAYFVVTESAPRDWTDVEVAMVEETADRTWAAVERARAEGALRESEEFHRLAAEAGNMGTWSVDLETGAAMLSPRMAELMGYAPDEHAAAPSRPKHWQQLVPRATWMASVHPDDRESLKQAIAAAKDDLRPYELEFRVQHNGETRWLYAKGEVTDDGPGAGRHLRGASVDITRRRELEEALVSATETVRQDIGRELHDVLSSDLAALAMKADNLARRATDEASADELGDALDDIAEGMRAATERSRTLSHVLMPSALQEEHLAAALEHLCLEQAELGSPAPTFEGNREEPLPENKETAMHLFRIAREAITNAQRHAAAEHIWVRLRREQEGLVLTVRDDGEGLPDMTDAQEGIGLQTMQHRADLIGATLRIESSEGDGTTVRCLLPRSEAEKR